MKKKSPARAATPRSRWVFGEPSSFLNGVLVGYTAVTFVLVLAYGLVRFTAELFGY